LLLVPITRSAVNVSVPSASPLRFRPERLQVPLPLACVQATTSPVVPSPSLIVTRTQPFGVAVPDSARESSSLALIKPLASTGEVIFTISEAEVGEAALIGEVNTPSE